MFKYIKSIIKSLAVITLVIVSSSCTLQKVDKPLNVIPEYTEKFNDALPKDEGIVLNVYNTIINAGSFFNLTASVFSDSKDVVLEYKSSDDSIATVGYQGRVVGISEGEAVITVSCGGLSANCTVVVINDTIPSTPTATPTLTPDITPGSSPTTTEQIKPTSIEITNVDEELSLNVGSSIVLKAIVYPEGASQDVIWILGNNRVATIDSHTGELSATYAPNDNGTGYSTVTVMSADGSVTASFDLTVYQRAKKITIKNDDTVIGVGEEFKISYKYSPSNSYKVKVTYSSSNESVVDVDSSGNVVGVGEGSAVITVRYSYNEDIYDTLKVTVTGSTEASDEVSEVLYADNNYNYIQLSVCSLGYKGFRTLLFK